MNNPVEEEEKAIARTLRLRAPPTPVARISRPAIIVCGALGGLGVAGALGWSLISRHRVPPEPPFTPAAPPPVEVTGLPRDYAARSDVPGVPVLGPPLPGDLGRPMVASGVAGADPPSRPVSAATPVPRASPGASAGQVARGSGLFVSIREERANRDGRPDLVTTPPERGRAQDDIRLVSPERLQPPASPYILQAGAIIPAALVTGLRSDLKGMAIAQVTQDVYDSLGGGHLLVPAGARLIGAYDDALAAGQSRLAVTWTRLVLPSGASIVLDDLPATDPTGMTGLQDGVDRHGRQVMTAAALSTLLAVGAEAGDSDESDLARAVRRGASSSVGEVGRQAVGAALALRPTLTIRSGAPLRVLVVRDLVLEPYVERRLP